MSRDGKLGLWVLTALVVGNMVGSGLFMLPNTLAVAANPLGVMLAWLFTGLGVLMIALVFGNLAIRKPELSGGPQMYAKGLFQEGSQSSHMAGYLASWGYWMANVSGNVAIITTFASYLSTFFPVMTSQEFLFNLFGFRVALGNFVTFVVCSMFLWINHMIILRGVEGAGRLNFIATAAKVLGFAFFIVIGIWAFDAAHMTPLMQDKLDESGQPVSFIHQVSVASMSTLWAFVGVESAVVFSSRARNKSDIKRSTIIGLLIATVIYLAISILAMGILTQEQLIASAKPLVDALSVVIGPSGSYVMAALGLIALIGSALGWILLSSEVPYQAAKRGMFMPNFAAENKYGSPAFSLTVTNILTQMLIFSTLSQSLTEAFVYVTTIAVLSVLFPYIVASIYQLRMTVRGETYRGQPRQQFSDGVIALLATAYSAWMIVSGTSDFFAFLSGAGLLISGIAFYPWVSRRKVIP